MPNDSAAIKTTDPINRTFPIPLRNSNVSFEPGELSHHKTRVTNETSHGSRAARPATIQGSNNGRNSFNTLRLKANVITELSWVYIASFKRFIEYFLQR